MFFQKVHNTLQNLVPSFRCSVHSYTYFFGGSRILFSISNVVCYCVIPSCQVRLTHSCWTAEAIASFLTQQFVLEHKLAGKKYPSITRRFKEKYGFVLPSARHALRPVEKLKKKYSLLDQRKGNSGRRGNTANNRNLNCVRNCLERAANWEPGKPEPTARKNLLGISKSSFNRITKQHLKLHLYKIAHVQKLQPCQMAPNSTECCELFEKTLKVNPSYLNHFEVDLEK